MPFRDFTSVSALELKASRIQRHGLVKHIERMVRDVAKLYQTFGTFVTQHARQSRATTLTLPRQPRF